MSDQTEAFKCVSAARELALAALRKLNRIVVDECEGYELYQDAYKEPIRESIRLLTKVIDNLY